MNLNNLPPHNFVSTKLVPDHGLLIVSRQSVEKEIAEKSLILIGELEDYFEEIWLLSAERKIKNPLAEVLMD